MFSKDSKIAQLVIENINTKTPTEWTEHLAVTTRGDKGFGSTDLRADDTMVTSNHQSERAMNSETMRTAPNLQSAAGSNSRMTKLTASNQQPGSMDSFTLSPDPYGPTMVIQCMVKGNVPCLGFDLDEESKEGEVILFGCRKGTPAARIPRWRRTLRGAMLIKMNDVPVHSKADVTKVVETLKENNTKKVDVTFVTIDKFPLHIQHGTLQVYTMIKSISSPNTTRRSESRRL